MSYFLGQQEVVSPGEVTRERHSVFAALLTVGEKDSLLGSYTQNWRMSSSMQDLCSAVAFTQKLSRLRDKKRLQTGEARAAETDNPSSIPGGRRELTTAKCLGSRGKSSPGWGVPPPEHQA